MVMKKKYVKMVQFITKTYLATYSNKYKQPIIKFEYNDLQNKY